MKPLLLKVSALLVLLPLASCMTTYDAAGRPVQSVDPAAATVGIAAAGLVGYAIGRNNEPRYCGPGYYGAPYHGGYYPRRCY
jgi:hypothetical protein